MNYTIIGQDGKKYGPAGGEQIRQWIAQARVESRTPVFVEGASDWTFLGLLPEFVPYFSGPPPVITALNGGATPAARTNQLATWGLICGILSWLPCCCCCFPFNLIGLVFSIIALVQIQSSPGHREGRGFAIAGLILSAANLLWCFGFTLANLASNNAHATWHMNSI